MNTPPVSPSDDPAMPLTGAAPLATTDNLVVAPNGRWFLADLLLIGLVAVLGLTAAITAGRRFQHDRDCIGVARELATAATAFQAYVRESGSAPADSAPGEMPAGLARFLPRQDWTAPSPVGGFYSWQKSPETKPGEASFAVGRIALTAFPPSSPLELSRADLRAIDAEIDDGNLASGNFRTGFNGWPILIVRTPPR